MSTLVICGGCGRELDYYEDSEPYQEREELCAECSMDEALECYDEDESGASG